jgi:hypothetical protein
MNDPPSSSLCPSATREAEHGWRPIGKPTANAKLRRGVFFRLRTRRISRAVCAARASSLRQLVLVSMSFTLCVGASLGAQSDNDSAAIKRRVKAAFMYKFAGYVEWPAGAFARADSPITIGVMGEDPLADELAQMVAGRTVEGRVLAVRKQRDDDLAADIHILFIARAESAQLKTIAAQSRPVLIVTESEGLLNQGSMINFVVVGGHLRFEISLENAEKRRLKLSSRLLTVAQSVLTGTP